MVCHAPLSYGVVLSRLDVSVTVTVCSVLGAAVAAGGMSDVTVSIIVVGVADVMV